jgi:hypothetical protein
MKILFRQGWIAITDFHVRQKNYQKSIFSYKALAIDNQNRCTGNVTQA